MTPNPHRGGGGLAEDRDISSSPRSPLCKEPLYPVLGALLLLFRSNPPLRRGGGEEPSILATSQKVLRPAACRRACGSGPR